MNFKKRVNGSWVDTPNYIHNTSTDTITTLPTVIYPTGTTATVGLKGNTLQSSTPSPTSPVTPQGTGERTANLSNVSDYTNDNTDTRTYFALRILMSKNGGQTETFSSSMQGTGEKSFTFTLTAEADTMRIVHNGSQRNLFIEELAGEFSGTYTYSFNLESNDPTTIGGLVLNDIMLNTGSQPLPYEPYGYKIPISSANTTTPVYLGEVQTTRKIKKIDLGTLNWSTTASGNFWADTSIPDCRIIGNSPIGNAICTHFTEVPANTVANTPYSFSSCLNTQARPFINKTGFENMSVTEFKEAMSGVYMYYVLTEPTTGIVNEPLRKIGDYADEVSGITIPTIAGANTISVDTTLQPSEVSANYKGWHPVQSVHEYDSNYTIATMQALTIAQLQTHTISDLQGGEWS